MTSNKYLGIIIHDKHQDDDDIMRYVKSLYSRGNMLISRFKTCSSSIKVKYLDHSVAMPMSVIYGQRINNIYISML